MRAGLTADSGRPTAIRTVLIHAGLWIAFVVLLTLPEGSRQGGPPPWSERAGYALVVLAFTLPPVYLHFALFERYYLRGRYLRHFILFGAITLGWAAAFHAISGMWMDRRAGIGYLVATILVVVFIGTAIKVLGGAGRQRLLLEQTRAKHLQAELDLLRAQVHPHFLFNTLNNLFGLARKGDPAAADGIARLSHLLRYMIYESNVDRVDLDKELEQIRRLIELEKLRFSSGDDIEVTLTVDPDLSSARVPPMLLIPLVENAFKHGIRRSAPSFVRMALSADEGSLHFTVENSLHPPRAGVGDQESGIGLQNLRRRLELLYPGAHQLTVGESGGLFRAELRLSEASRGAR